VGDLRPLLGDLPFANPNTLEGRMALAAPRFETDRPYLLCCPLGLAFCNPLNLVQKVCPNRKGGDRRYSARSLMKRFEEGYRIDLRATVTHLPNACHQEFPLSLELRGPRLREPFPRAFKFLAWFRKTRNRCA
jgi:hypothetical protein